MWSLGAGEDNAVVAVGALKGHNLVPRKSKHRYFLKYYQHLYLLHNNAKSSLAINPALLPAGLAS